MGGACYDALKLNELNVLLATYIDDLHAKMNMPRRLHTLLTALFMMTVICDNRGGDNSGKQECGLLPVIRD